MRPLQKSAKYLHLKFLTESKSFTNYKNKSDTEAKTKNVFQFQQLFKKRRCVVKKWMNFEK